MSWGERSCVKPCRSSNCTIETCNVDCQDYVWDGETRPDSKSIKKVEEKLKNSVLNKALNSVGLDIMDAFPKIGDPLKGLDLEKEYNLVIEKKSKLSSRLRHMVKVRY